MRTQAKEMKARFEPERPPAVRSVVKDPLKSLVSDSKQGHQASRRHTLLLEVPAPFRRSLGTSCIHNLVRKRLAGCTTKCSQQKETTRSCNKNKKYFELGNRDANASWVDRAIPQNSCRKLSNSCTKPLNLAKHTRFWHLHEDESNE